MPNIIHLLSDAIANQIAAGEVVQRPASAVKELLENAIDAGSSRIQMVIRDAGKQLIQVIDDGSGMSETDARMCFERHATSKLHNSDDLFKIKTLGFRGEAMASIAAVAQVELKTRKEEDEIGTIIKIEGSEVKLQEPAATNKGTSISVKNLFFNVPARRNFLKSNPVEMKHILDEFHRVALSFPEISFSLMQNDMEVYNLPSEKLSRRIISLFGNTYKEQLIPIQEETEAIRIHGYVGTPSQAKKTRGEQFFFVNNRFIKHNYLHHAVMGAFNDLLPNDSYPFYVIFIDLDPKHIDVNVHPTKTEIKFDDERTLYAIMHAATKKALGSHNIVPSIDFEQDVNFGILNTHISTENLSAGGLYGNKNPGFRTGNDNWEQLYKNFENPDSQRESSQPQMITFGSAANNPNNTEEGRFSKDRIAGENNNTFQLHQKYIVTQIKSGMVIIDQKAAHERILYEKYIGSLENRSGASQQSLFPQSLELNPTDFALVMELEKEIKALGFEFNAFGKNSIVINGIPADITGESEKAIFEGLLEQFKTNNRELKLERKENLARSLSRKSGMKEGTKLSALEMSQLIDQLFGCKVPNYGPYGNPTFVIIDLDRIGKMFDH